MARGTTLGELVRQLRVESNLDLNEALSLNLLEPMKEALRKEQERLYDDFDWPFLKGSYDKQLQAGQRYYDLPADLNLERIHKVDVKYGGEWRPVERGIGLDHYNVHDSDMEERQSPVQCWDLRDVDGVPQIEVWPIPSDNYDEATGDGALRFRGIRKLKPLIQEAHTAELDDQIIVLFCAAERLAGMRDSESAKIKFNKAKARLDNLQGRVTRNRRTSFGLGSDPSVSDRPAPRIIVAKAGS